jgi:transcriptional regulator with XRE-family HTH domain
MSIGERILLALEYSKKNQADLARYLSTKSSTVTGWIKEGRTPSAASVVPICEFTGVTVIWLLTGEGEMFVSKELEQKQINTTIGNNNTGVQVATSNSNMSLMPGISQASLVQNNLLQRGIFLSQPEAESITALAKLSEVVLEKMEKLGGFMIRMFHVPYDAVSPWVINWWRLRVLDNMLQTVEDSNEILRNHGVSPEEGRSIQLKIGIPVLEAAGMEEEPELRKMWATLLANARDPNYDLEMIKKGFVNVIKELCKRSSRK